MQLYNYFRSSAAIRVRIALNYKQLNYSKIDINLINNDQRGDDYLSINPTGLVPALNDNGNVIFQSLAILEYLEETYSAPPILPKDSIARAYVRELALSVACDIHPLNNLRVLNYITNTLNHLDDEKNQWYQHWIHTGLSSLEATIAKSKFYTGKYCYQNMLTIADIYLIPQLINAKRFNCSLDNYPTLVAIDNECLKLKSVQDAIPPTQ